MKKIDSVSFLSSLRDHNSAFESEKSRCFDKDEETAAMEFTACHNRKSHVVKRVTARLPLEKLTL